MMSGFFAYKLFFLILSANFKRKQTFDKDINILIFDFNERDTI